VTLGPLMIDVAGCELSAEDRELLRHPVVGGIILFARNYVDSEQLTALTAAIHAARTPPLIIGVDQEGGRVQRFRTGFSVLPAARRLGHEFHIDTAAGLELARRLGWLMAAELRAHGVDLSFAPCVDLDYGASEVIGDRALGARFAAVAQLAVAYAHGMRDAGMAATAKHFPGHGAVVADSHATLPVDRRELADLQDDIAPYRLLIANALAGVMAAHVLYPAVDALPASFSQRWITQILRGELRFQGAVFTDDLSMGATAAVGDLLRRAQLALAAGCDMLLACNDRAGAAMLIERLHPEPAPASQLRLVRMRGRESMSLQTLHATPTWLEAREALARVMAPPALQLQPGPA
jgi:beta-N-acetylhexosaminidase